MPKTLSPKITSQYAWAPLEAWTSAAVSATQYVARAVERRSTPLDIVEDFAEFARVATLREKPTWAYETPEVQAWPIARLVDYSVP